MSRVSEQLWWVRLLRLAAAGLGAAALIILPVQQADVPGFSLANYFSYFTVLSNVAAVIVLAVGALAAPDSAAWQWIRGAVTTAMVITGIVYALLLSDIDVNLDIDWINDVLHRLLPVLLLVDWAVIRPRRLPDHSWWTWLLVPLVYGVYTLTRGPFVDWYPYPFIDPRTQGYLSMTLSMVIVFVGMAGLSFAVFWLGTRRSPW
ncbi:Pr6Pr family membrane protein [Gordonia sp. VNK1]|uniref:Pr6Pr family membrane protein n=1 Tax=Gordonia oleivorans TaxID=3156618 RepID=UPI0032B50274